MNTRRMHTMSKDREDMFREAFYAKEKRVKELRLTLAEMYKLLDKKDEEIKRLQGIIADKNCQLAEVQDFIDMWSGKDA